ncbi:MAG: KH domain-containing protein [Patescibacteria group bacterium]
MTAKEMTDQEYVESMVKPLVDHPDEVVTTRVLDERGVLIQLTVNQEDMGKVIGREGRTAKAIRSLLRVFGARASARINLKIVEPDGGEVAIAPDVDSNADKAEQPIAEQPSSEQPSSEQATEVI